MNTYWSKQLKPFVVAVGGDRYRVSEGFRPFMTWKKFQRHVSQNRLVAADYRKREFRYPVVFEFFMPLTNETALRTTLDTLFFRENIEAKLRAIEIAEMAGHFSRPADEGDEAYLQRAASWIADHFGGYSIYHVEGRFRAWKLATHDEAMEREKQGYRYLVDETTAVTRFIFPCEEKHEAALVRYFFDALFARSIIQLINAEDEIWMVESGDEHRVHSWRVDEADDDGSF
ncbi:MAG: hypothetical protein OXH52_16360 [Gammaproteobacteria bacterium]|nr:hypothetical protein [Gammaproteobacteria bacterium]